MLGGLLPSSRAAVIRPVITRAALVLGAFVSCCWIAGATPSFAQVSGQVIWQMATEYPQSSLSGSGLSTFGKLMAARTKGFVTTTNAFDNELKITSANMIEAARDRRIAGGDAFAGPLEATDPIFGLASLPFVVQSIDAAKAVNGKAKPLYSDALKARGLRLLYITIWPATGIWSTRPIKSPDDLKQMAIRAYDNNSAEVMRAVGAAAEYLPFNEAIARIKDHKLNAILTSGDGGAGRKLWDDLRFFTAINYAIPVSIAFVREADFAALAPDMQEQVIAAADETERSQHELLTNRTAENYKRMEANGVTIEASPSASVIAALKAAGGKPVSAWRAKVSPEAGALLDLATR